MTLAFAARCLAAADQLDEAERVLTGALDEAARHHAAYRIGPLLAYRSEIRLWAGDAAGGGGRRRGSAGDLADGGPHRGARGNRDAGAGADRARRPRRRAGGPGRRRPRPIPTATWTRCCSTPAAGCSSRAAIPRRRWTELREVGRRLEIVGERNPALVDWRSQAAIALARAGTRASKALALAREELELARRVRRGARDRVALRACGVIERSEPRLREAVATCYPARARGWSWPARSRSSACCCAAIAGSSRHASRCGSALDLAEGCGAQPLAAFAGTELRIAGARPRRARLTGAGALTTNEAPRRRAGRRRTSNAEIAEALFVSRKTVEKHLGAAYRKLGIATRARARGRAGQRVGHPPHTRRRCGAEMLAPCPKSSPSWSCSSSRSRRPPCRPRRGPRFAVSRRRGDVRGRQRRLQRRRAGRPRVAQRGLRRRDGAPAPGGRRVRSRSRLAVRRGRAARRCRGGGLQPRRPQRSRRGELRAAGRRKHGDGADRPTGRGLRAGTGLADHRGHGTDLGRGGRRRRRRPDRSRRHDATGGRGDDSAAPAGRWVRRGGGLAGRGRVGPVRDGDR